MATMDISRFDDLCRLCAAKTTLVLGIHIFQNDGIVSQIPKKIESCLPIQVYETDELPKMICENCLYKLNMLSDFRDRTIRTQRLLVELFKDTNDKIHSHQTITEADMEHELIMVQHQQLLANHDMTTVDQIDLSQLGHREQMIVGHEIILTHQSVDINDHSLANITLSHHDLTNQNMSNQNLQAPRDDILVEAPSDHTIEGTLDLIQHQHLLTDPLRFQHELQMEPNLSQHSFHLHNEKKHVNYQNTNQDSVEMQLIKIEDHDPLKSFKGEDSNSNNSLLIDEQLSKTTDVNQIYAVDENESNLSNNSTVQTGNHPDARDWLYCNICEKSYEEESEFEAHYQTHFQKCDICMAVFTNSEILNSHRKEVHSSTEEEKPIKTRLTRATLPLKLEDNDSNSDDSVAGDFADNGVDEEETGENLPAEPEKEGNKKKIWAPKVCTWCGKTYKTNYKLNEHLRKHTGEKPYKCKSCDKEFRSKIGLAQHEAKHTGKYDYSCPTCGKGFQCKSYLMVHQRVHSDIKPYPCTTCGRNFKTKQSLLDHTNRHLGVKPYMCETCGRGFITKGLCKAHQKVHTGLDNRKYACKVCNKMFVSKSYLQTHLRIHTGEKPFICEVCGKGFLTKVDLRIHNTMHTGEKSYVCEMCGKAFARRDALRCHRRSHTGERPYSCDLCGQTFTQFTPMAIHKRLHTGERPYACESCGKTFVSRSTMTSHAKKHLR